MVNSKLIAKLHLRQVEVLTHLSKIENGIDKTIPMKDFLRVITGDSKSKTTEFAAVFGSLLTDVRTMIRKQFKELAYRSHDWAVDALTYAIPAKVLEYIAPIEPIFEQYQPDRPGRLIFENGMMRLVYEDESKPFGVPSKLVKKDLSDEDKEQIRRDVLFPPPSQTEVNRIINTGRHVETSGGTHFENWEARFDKLSKQITDKKLAFNELATGYSQGENIRELQKRLEPIVGGIKASAARIARTEGSRIAEQIQRRTWDGLGDMMVGARIIAVLDERTRPEHATRNGRTYYRRPGPGQKSIGELPDLPDAANCRCISSPILEPPEDFKKDPKIRDEYRAASGSSSGEPSTYEEWFASASIAKRKMVTGVQRYATIQNQLADKREPRWSDFINPDGELLSLEQLENETITERTARTTQINRSISIQKKAIKAISSRGFERPNRPGSSRDIRRTLSGLSFSGKVDLKLSGIDSDDLEEILADYLPGASVKDLVTLSGAPDGSKVTILERGQFLVIDFDYVADGKSVSASRAIIKDRGKVALWNLKILVEPSGKQLGLDVFRRQVDTAVSLGIQEIQCTAERGPSQNGYYTWAVFGYEANGINLPEKMLSEEGQADWLANGKPFHGTFDLRSGSRSRQVFDRYYGRKMQERNKDKNQ
jgi:SPP1 gp7 family putative phage head morphogenesis protein